MYKILFHSLVYIHENNWVNKNDKTIYFNQEYFNFIQQSAFIKLCYSLEYITSYHMIGNFLPRKS